MCACGNLKPFRKGKKILFVGLACLDIVVTCDSFPEEDSDRRCKSQRWCRGGNASNNCTVLSNCEIPCEYLGTLSLDHGGEFLKEDFVEHGINIRHCIYFTCDCPTSVVILNSENGSRTILHSNRNLPELSFEDFVKLDLGEYKWIHFEGRNESILKKIIIYIEEWNAINFEDKITISLELEKAKKELKSLLPYGHFTFISKDFAEMCGCDNMDKAVKMLSSEIKPGSVLICPWGELGATARLDNGMIVASPAYPPTKIISTLGAGDTFVAATIYALLKEKSVLEAINIGCKVAGAKCGYEGIEGVGSLLINLTKIT